MGLGSGPRPKQVQANEMDLEKLSVFETPNIPYVGAYMRLTIPLLHHVHTCDRFIVLLDMLATAYRQKDVISCSNFPSSQIIDVLC